MYLDHDEISALMARVQTAEGEVATLRAEIERMWPVVEAADLMVARPNDSRMWTPLKIAVDAYRASKP